MRTRRARRAAIKRQYGIHLSNDRQAARSAPHVVVRWPDGGAQLRVCPADVMVTSIECKVTFRREQIVSGVRYYERKTVGIQGGGEADERIQVHRAGRAGPGSRRGERPSARCQA